MEDKLINETISPLQGLTAGFHTMAQQLLEFLPRVLLALLVLLVGWLLARLLSSLLVRAIGRVDELWHRMISKRGLAPLQTRHPPTRMMGQLLFWILMLIFITISSDILGLNIFGIWLKEVISYIPLAAAGLLIVVVGFVVSSLARDLVSSAVVSAGMTQGDLLGRSVQMVILFIAVILGIDQIGINTLFLSVIAGIILASMLGGIALAFGLGARTHVSNIIAANQMRHIYQTGDRVRIGDVEGLVLEISVSRVIIETEDGSVDVPAKLFDEQISVIVEKGSRT
ncbi:MAG: mechanosensitive ion channel [Gammaproteobacteria bacterium]|nr:mechanosensitive ion channel [Gammaproteobacteria bacterium]